MTNEDILIAIKGHHELTNEMHDFIYRNYTKVDSNTSGKNFIMTCRPGSDYKYGRYKIDPVRMLRRGLSFDEFYGGGIVD